VRAKNTKSESKKTLRARVKNTRSTPRSNKSKNIMSKNEVH
jgi:hypothetical protein